VGLAIVSLCALLITGLAPPASAAVWCHSAYWEVRKGSGILNTTLYRFRHTLNMCSDQNSSYWTITSINADYVTAYDIDGSWSYEGLVHDVVWSDYYLGLWVNYWTQKGAHFKQSFWIYNDNLYPRVDLLGNSEGHIYYTYAYEG
jgi:hypothetical protein